MKLALIAIVSCMALSVKSMTHVTGIGLEGKSATAEALLPAEMHPRMPVIDVQSTDLICRTSSMSAKVKPLVVEAGTNIGLVWDTKNTSPYTDAHPHGPCTFWLAPYASKGTGQVWSKFQEFKFEGDNDSAKWCTDKILDKGYYVLNIPAYIGKGKYYLRTEIIDITDAQKTNYEDFTAGPRFHSNCMVLEVTSNSTAPLKNPVNILEAYKKYYKTPLFPKGTANSNFTLPGPAPYSGDAE
ncbi:hypothetical protein GGI09_004541 [Coemansia sp. S100]|nr:hypothetical protein LPJ71_001714 [Coemansia sp. S17]KAJ2074892.1 hypothetical protein GGH13_000999 [Coemansia sp. S155-1]KAJ2096084.1 hypothetical protein GGI09_004541 [Coemansia sp. S100]